LTKNGPISSIAPSPREEHPGPEISRHTATPYKIQTAESNG
jgi:hypothetical protein